MTPGRHGTHIPQKKGRGGCCGRWRAIFVVCVSQDVVGRATSKIKNIVDDGSRDHKILPVTGTGWLDRSPTVKSGSGVMSGTASDLRFFQKLNFRERGIN